MGITTYQCHNDDTGNRDGYEKDRNRNGICTYYAVTSIIGGNMTEPSPSKEKDLFVLRRNSQCESINMDYMHCSGLNAPQHKSIC